MAGAGGRRNTKKGKTDKLRTANRAEFIKEIRKYYTDQQKRWGMKGVKLQFSTRKQSGLAGGYTGSGKKGENKGTVIISIPNTIEWSNHYRREGRTTNPITEGKKIIRFEMAHHRQRLKEDAGKSTDTDAHGPQYDKQVRQHAGRLASEKPPKYVRKGPGGRPKAKASRRNIARKKPPRTGPPRNAPIKRRINQKNIRYRT